MKFLIFRLIILSLLFSYTAEAFSSSIEDQLSGKIDIVVSQDGSGDYNTVQEAINAVPDNSGDTTVIFIRNGRYYEKIVVPYTKINLTLIGENADSTILTYDDNPASTGGNTFGTTSFKANAENFTAINITFENSAGATGQALAFYSSGDKQLFYHCRFLGFQDTYYINWRVRNYMKDCFIEGAVDYIYGYGIGVYDSCQIHTIRTGGVITAAASSEYNSFGLTFTDCRLTTPTGISGILLGRPWQSKPHVAYLHCNEPATLSPTAWTNMNTNRNPIFAEYECFGPGFKPDQRSTNSDFPGIQLTEEQAQDYLSLNSIFAASSFASLEEDTMEVNEMFKPFYDANLVDLIREVMFSGRDTFPDIPQDDWVPELDDNIFIQTVKENFKPFLDSSFFTAPVIESLSVGGTPLEGFDPATTLYGIEITEGDTIAPIVEVVVQDAIVEISYPESIPGYTQVDLYSKDYVTKLSYKIYNSIDSIFWDADLVFLGFNRTDTIPLIDGVYEYDIPVNKNVSRISSFQLERSYAKATYKKSLPDEIPGTGTVVVTALGKTAVNTYTLNFSYTTEKEDISATNLKNDIRILSPSRDQGVVHISNSFNGLISLNIFDITGAKVSTQAINLSSADQFISLDLSVLETGIYLYRISARKNTYAGKLLKID